MTMTSKALKKLRETFIDEDVVFYLKDMNVPLVSSDGEDFKISGMTDGYVIDIDENYYYLGDKDGGIDRVISHDIITIVEIALVIDESMKAFLELPSDDEVH